MTNRQIKSLTCIAVVIAAGLGVLAPSSAAAGRRVHPGDSIQDAVDYARPGDTITVMPGTYYENVLITKRLTLRGFGARTVIKPPVTAVTPAAPAPTPAAAAPGAAAAPVAPAAAPAAGAAGKAPSSRALACSQADTGICVMGTAEQPVVDVDIRSLTVSGFKRNGIWASYTDRLSVQRVIAEKNGTWGIAQERSTRGLFRDNTARDNTESGLFIANTVDREGGATDTLGAVVRRNTLTGNRIGVTVRRVRNLSVYGNTLTGNCGGIFVVGDEGEPGAGDMTIRNNRIHENNKFCKGNTRLPDIQGVGIVLTGAEQTVVRSNDIRGNVGASPLSGGILLFKSFVGATNTDNVIRDNVVRDNKPADLANQGTGTGNQFVNNRCASSVPAGMC
ncbi:MULTISPECIES: right-handed parallel beta-helix repeat-containing protein [Streptomyces]|uniref:right-handed parallel beta-helix repeat-containing protein n=1 Tax=Streptomyces TaxID=1883 RepID=UPI00207ABE2C|nr:MULTISPECIES: right-handed parallel beta-helix repeat-containing protein [Streptomyces]MCM9078173.1 right-handed parallel beta-helix repeat-containing protein [Streptomyces spororaveus]MCX5307410.1 right-handed parallel beta-helix repeat-containing protein [Streptomyces sp. NBC_00160]